MIENSYRMVNEDDLDLLSKSLELSMEKTSIAGKRSQFYTSG